jgi:hypothetical protein
MGQHVLFPKVSDLQATKLKTFIHLTPSKWFSHAITICHSHGQDPLCAAQHERLQECQFGLKATLVLTVSTASHIQNWIHVWRPTIISSIKAARDQSIQGVQTISTYFDTTNRPLPVTHTGPRHRIIPAPIKQTSKTERSTPGPSPAVIPFLILTVLLWSIDPTL